MTGNEIVSTFYEGLSIQSDDTDVTDRTIMTFINNARSLWVKRTYNKTKTSVDPRLIQDLKLLAMEKVDSILVPQTVSQDFTSECYYAATVEEIPRVVEYDHGLLFTRIGSPDNNAHEYPMRDNQEINYSGYGRFNGDVTYAFFYGDKIYLQAKSESPQFVKGIAVRGVFEDPFKVFDFNDGVATAWTMEDEYPISRAVITEITPMVEAKLLKQIQMPDDDTNDADDDIKQPVPTR